MNNNVLKSDVEPFLYDFDTIPEDLLNVLKQSHHIENIQDFRKKYSMAHLVDDKNSIFGLFGSFDDVVEKKFFEPVVETGNVVWGTGDNEQFFDEIVVFKGIKQRVLKSVEEQRHRVKDKAEVFTPLNVCALQNNLVDENLVKKGLLKKNFLIFDNFNNFIVNKDKIVFGGGFGWVDYVVQNRLESACGEGPYVVSPYDATTGSFIPVKDNDDVFSRIGFLDRKFRVVSENASNEDWLSYSFVALLSTFGFEWQGDNLMIARLNVLNSFIEYFYDFFGFNPDFDVLLDVAEIVSWNFFQMDGLKLVVPESCSDSCVSCRKDVSVGHDGTHPAVRFLRNNTMFETVSFESLVK